ncbi:MAG: hypothetical protein AB7O38_08215 [Pirellulaceae bacterium]
MNTRSLVPLLGVLLAASILAPDSNGLRGQTPGDPAAGSRSPAGLALESIFNPQRAPAQKTMGLLQRSFLDLVEESAQELQVAFVLDGTDSMAADIAGVRAALRNMVDDLRQYKGDHVSFALVVYRDIGSPSGSVSTLLSQFTKDEAALAGAFDKIVPETGKPYFLELADVGVHEALDKLDWSQDKDTSRWLMVFGDAPPYDANFTDSAKNGGARRHFDTDLLVSLAVRKGIKVNCVLCTSRPEERAVYEQVLDKTRQFMNALSTGSGGLMLDLSYPDIQAAIVDAAKKLRSERRRIGTITRDDVESARRAATASRAPVAAGQRLRVAVVPHMPLEQVSFDPTHEAVQIAAELRQKFRNLPQTEVKSPVDVERALRRVKAANIDRSQWLQALAVQLRVDYVVWGSIRKAAGIVGVQTAVYSKTDGQPLADAKVLTSNTLPETELASNVVGKLSLVNLDQRRAPELHAAFASVRSNSALNDQLLRPVANNVAARPDLLTGFEALEQALAYPIGDAAAQKLLVQAEEALNRAVAADPRNPFAHMLVASCQYNLSHVAANAGQAEAAQARMQQMVGALKRAFLERKNAQVELLTLEITADHQLLVNKNFQEAIKVYEQLATAPNDATLHTALRAHWMLAGIYSGDWHAPAEVVNPQKAREHLINILAHWPESPEASFIKTSLRWSEEKGRNQLETVPLQNNI